MGAVIVSEIRGLSVRQPWSWAICAGVKRTENRTWTTQVRGTIAIHASTSAQVVNNALRSGEKELPTKDWFTFGAIIGLADIVDIASYGPQHEHDPFAEGPYCWTMANGRFLHEPIPLKGKLNLFKIAPELQEQLRGAETTVIDLDSDPVAAAVAQAMTPEPDPVQSYLELFQEMMATGNHQEAMSITSERLLALAPDESDGYLLRGLMRLQDPSERSP